MLSADGRLGEHSIIIFRFPRFWQLTFLYMPINRLYSKRMSVYIDTENTDMQQFAFKTIQGVDMPVWKDVTSAEELNVTRISGAMTNIIFKVVVKDKECQPLLLRAYGNGTDLFFDREKELSYFKVLSDAAFGVKLVKTFPGGRLEIWCSGYDAITAPQMRSEEVFKKTAKKMATMHNIELPSHDENEYWNHLNKWNESILKICTKEEFKNFRLDLIHDELANLKSLIQSEDYETVFGHHDLQHGNILMNADGDMMFVDFEYSGQIPIGVDFANHFCEWMTDYNLPDSHILRRETYPSLESQKILFHTYLTERYGKEPTEEEVNHLQQLVHHQELLSHFFWFLWGLLQYQVSDIDWDYYHYFYGRWNYYKTMKKEIYGVDALPILP